MSKSDVEWTGFTWNLISWCSKISDGCKKCFAMQMAKRLQGMGQKKYQDLSRVICHPEELEKPLTWKKPRTVFVCSMSDLFHPDVPFEFIAAIFGVMAATPQHTYQVLTKRPERALEWFRWMEKEGVMPVISDSIGRYYNLVHPGPEYDDDEPTPLAKAHEDILDGGFWDCEDWPLVNVWFGVTAENQQMANQRIPVLMQIPAAVRFVSCEPLLGPIDLTKWVRPIIPMQPDDAPKTWAEWVWDSWVPHNIREQIEEFWNEGCGRGPKAWLNDAVGQGSAPYGCKFQQGDIRGMWIHCWNNCGRLVDENGKAHFASIPRTSLFDPGPGSSSFQGINWVIVGGETGPGARPMDLTWARSIRDQCFRAGVPFFFKKTGPPPRDRSIPKESVRLLDGRTWEQMPEPAANNVKPIDIGDREQSQEPDQRGQHGKRD